MVYLFINVAWGDPYIPHILGTLHSHHAKATFFLDGTWLSKHSDTAKIIVRAGHLLGNHGYTHRNMSTLTQEAQKQEIEKTNKLLRQTGITPTFFAPPSGDYSPTTLRAASAQGMFTVHWTVDTIDWRTPSASTILARVVPRLEPGCIILMHPTASASAALDSLLDAIEQKHLRLGTAEDLVSSARVARE
jgi:probable sporulation protein (polysaccharide deacetylase family)